MVYLAIASKSDREVIVPAGTPTLDFGSEYNKLRLQEWLRNNQGRQIEVKPITPTRSIKQNKFYWTYLEQIELETGNRADYLHEYYKRHLLPPKFINIKGKEFKIPASTTELKKREFIEYLDKICADCGVEIPDAEAYKKWKNSAPLAGEKFQKK